VEEHEGSAAATDLVMRPAAKQLNSARRRADAAAGSFSLTGACRMARRVSVLLPGSVRTRHAHDRAEPLLEEPPRRALVVAASADDLVEVVGGLQNGGGQVPRIWSASRPR
jgi:hypothetical protein